MPANFIAPNETLTISLNPHNSMTESYITKAMITIETLITLVRTYYLYLFCRYIYKGWVNNRAAEPEGDSNEEDEEDKEYDLLQRFMSQRRTVNERRKQWKDRLRQLQVFRKRKTDEIEEAMCDLYNHRHEFEEQDFHIRWNELLERLHSAQKDGNYAVVRLAGIEMQYAYNAFNQLLDEAIDIQDKED